MQKLLVVVAILVLSRVAMAQSPYWQAVTSLVQPVTNYQVLDSLTVSRIGTDDYYLDGPSKTWKPSPRPIPSVVSAVYAYWYSPTILKNDTAYYSHFDTLFTTIDSGIHWNSVGRFGDSVKISIPQIFETPSGITVVQNSVNKLFFSHDGFRTYDSAQAPGQVQNSADTLFYLDRFGNLLHSADLGKQWDTLQALNDSTRAHWKLYLFPSAYVISAYHSKDSVTPYRGYMAYSRDGGRTFQRTNLPATHDSIFLSLAFGDSNRFYVSFQSNFSGTTETYRSDNWGKNWNRIGSWYNLSINEKEGALYWQAGPSVGPVMRSTDHGYLWDTVYAWGLTEPPLSVERVGGQTYASTPTGTYSSWNDGVSWNRYTTFTGFITPWVDGRLALSLALYFNAAGKYVTTTHLGVGQPETGVITDSNKLWVRYRGKIYCSYDSSASFYAFAVDPAKDAKGILRLTGDTVLAIYAHGAWKAHDIVTGLSVSLPEGSKLTGAAALDSMGAIYLARTDGSLLVSNDRANTWQQFASPASTPTSVVTKLTSGPVGTLWAITTDTISQQALIYQYDSSSKSWIDISKSIPRSDSTMITNVWYVNNFVYAGTNDMGLFRAVKSSHAGVRTLRNIDDTITISPNPVTQSFTVFYEPDSDGWVSIIDVTGREVLREPIARGGSEVTFDCSELPSGMYLVRIATDKSIAAMKFIKN